MRRLSIVVGAFVAIAVTYSVVVPLFEAPDELQHFATIDYIGRYKWFPPLGEPGQHLWDQETLQAPIYYWAAAALTFWLDTSDLGEQAVLQPKANVGDATLPGKKNAFLHPASQSFPYRGTTLAVHLARLFSIALGAGTIALTFLTARLLFERHPMREQIALLSAALLAFVPQFIFIHSSVNNDTAIIFTSTLSLYLLLLIAVHGLTVKRAVALGIAVGLMALSKLTGTVLALVALSSLPLLSSPAPGNGEGKQRTSLNAPVRRRAGLTIAAGLTLLVCGWWYVRNQFVYGDPLALGAFLNFVGGNTGIPAVSTKLLVDQFRLLRFSTWGLFGHISVLMQPTWVYLWFDAITLTGLLTAAFCAWRTWARLRPVNFTALGIFAFQYRAMLMTLIWAVTVLALAARWFFAAGIQGRLIYPAMPALIVLIAAGLLRLPLPKKSLAVAVVAPTLMIAIAAVPLYLIPAYSPPRVIAQLPASATATSISLANEIELEGYAVWQEANLLHIDLYWRALARPSFDYTVALRLVQSDGALWLDYVNYPGMGTTFPTTWQAGELRHDPYQFDVNRFSAVAEPLRMIVGLFDRRSGEMLAISGWHDVQEDGWATLTYVSISSQSTK